MTEQQDGTGYQYRRNRYYNPEAGQFTQEDPIGLAGGMNLYGFAGGDPVNFSDAFGLCPDPKDPHCTDIPAVEISTPRNIVKAAATVASVGTFGRVMSAAIDWAFGKSESPSTVELPGSNKQFGKKYGEHMDSNTPGYRSAQEYRARANEIYNDPHASRTTFPTNAPVYPGETHIRSGDDLLRLDPQGSFRSMYQP